MNIQSFRVIARNLLRDKNVNQKNRTRGTKKDKFEKYTNWLKVKEIDKTKNLLSQNERQNNVSFFPFCNKIFYEILLQKNCNPSLQNLFLF